MTIRDVVNNLKLSFSMDLDFIRAPKLSRIPLKDRFIFILKKYYFAFVFCIGAKKYKEGRQVLTFLTKKFFAQQSG